MKKLFLVLFLLISNFAIAGIAPQQVDFAPVGGIAGTNIGSAVTELEAEKANLNGSSTVLFQVATPTLNTHSANAGWVNANRPLNASFTLSGLGVDVPAVKYNASWVGGAGTIDLKLTDRTTNGICGILLVRGIHESNQAYNTSQAFTVFGNGTDMTITGIGAAVNGTGGASAFTVANSGASNTVRITDAEPSAGAFLYITFYGMGTQ